MFQVIEEKLTSNGEVISKVHGERESYGEAYILFVVVRESKPESSVTIKQK